MKSKSKLSDRLSVLFLLGCAFLNAQNHTPEMYAGYAQKYPGHHLIKLGETQKIIIKMVKDVPKLTFRTEEEYLVLDKMGSLGLSDQQIQVNAFETVTEINAYTLSPDGKSFKKIKVNDFQTRSSQESSVFHDGSKEITFLYQGLTEGAIRHLDYTYELSENYLPFGASFFDVVPSENSRFIIEADTAVHLLLKPYHFEGQDIQTTEEIVKGKRIITYYSTKPLIVKEEVAAANPRYYAPQILAQIASYSTKKGMVNLTGSIDDLHRRYTGNVAEVVSEEPNADLKKIADSVTANCTTELEKVRNIYYWVQDNVKYIAFEEGIGGFVPRQPSAVLQKRYGDCKDMASLIYALLKAANIPAYLTWIGSRDLPYKYTDFPSTYCDNHMITAYKSGDKIYFLDATNSFQSMNYPTSFIQGKQALINLDNDHFEIAEVPVIPAAENAMVDSTFVKIDASGLTGHTTVVHSGYYNSVFGHLVRNVAKKDRPKMYSGVYERGNNSFAASNVIVNGEDERDSPISTSFDWKVANYVTQLDKELYVNMILNKNFCVFDRFEDNRIAPMESDQTFDDTYVVSMDIPQGYKVKYLPENQEFKTDYYHFSISYAAKGDKLIMTLKYVGDYLILPASEFGRWNEFIKIKNDALSETVVLVKN